LRRHYQANQRLSSLEARHEQLAGDPGADLALEYAELAERVEAAIAQLPARCQLIFRLSRDQGFAYREIADMLDISLKTVETQMGRALKKLRVLLER
jgi:RNA polymerase sigma factor (sigma-70 family)